MILQSASRKRLTLYMLSFVSIVGFGLLLVSRFNATAITPASNAVENSAEQNQAEPMKPTDKTEVAQTDLIAVTPSSEVTSAEQALPREDAPGYRSACQNMKLMYTNEHSSKLQAENNRYASARQQITNTYNREGKSFSKSEKFAHAWETKRHESIVEQINAQYQKQLKKLSC